MNKFSITINGVNYTKKAYFAPKWNELLDRRLDEGYVYLKGVKKAEPFTPLDTVLIGIENAPETLTSGEKPSKAGVTQSYNPTTKKLTQTQELQFVAARDTPTNYPVGSEFYIHEIFLIEPTKIAERYVCDSIAFTNALGRELAKTYTVCNAKLTLGDLQQRTSSKIYINTPINSNVVTLPSTVALLPDIAKFNNQTWYDLAVDALQGTDTSNPQYTKLEIYDTANNLLYNYTFPQNAEIGTHTIDLSSYPQLNGVSLVLKYIYYGVLSGYIKDTLTLSYETSFLAAQYPLKPWTVTDAIIRCCDLVEPLRAKYDNGQLVGKDLPKFRLNGVSYDADGNATVTGGQALEFDKVELPAMALTKCTFREQLQELGKIIHAEPRITIQDGYYEITYTKYGERKYSDIKDKPYIAETSTQSVDEYCNALDSTVDNLTNSLSMDEGAITEPYNEGAKSLRTDTMTATITDDGSAIIQTLQPIQKVYKVEMKGLKNASTYYDDFIKIPAFISEKATYDTLSSYEGRYPYAKAFSLYYTQGEKNIKGLFFKEDGAFFPEWFKKYAIQNIATICGQPLYEGQTDEERANAYSQILFRVTYEPIFGQRVKQYKTKIGNNKSSLVYNQGSNLIETRYYGENLKGAVAKMGNAEKSLTYQLPYLTDIPTAGELFDKDYYISAVSNEIMPFYFKTTVDLSKDFNRLSEFIGINSVNRMFEVSEKQAMQRDSVFCETLLLTDDHTAVGDAYTLFQSEALKQIAASITYFVDWYDDGITTHYNYGGTESLLPQRISYVSLATRKKDTSVIACLGLPIVSSAFGNSMAFSFKFEDNYSAGQKVSAHTVNGLTRYVADYVKYTDDYGRFYWLELNFKESPVVGSGSLYDFETSNENKIPFMLPEQDSTTLYKSLVSTFVNFIEYQKDNIEIPSISYQINIQTDGDYIIGSGFARNCSLVCGTYPVLNDFTACRVYIFDDAIPQLAEKAYPDENDSGKGFISFGNEDNKYIDFVFSDGSGGLVNYFTAYKAGKSWAVITPRTTRTITISDENGNITTQEIDEGSEIIFAKNVEIKAGDVITLPRILVKKEQD